MYARLRLELLDSTLDQLCAGPSSFKSPEKIGREHQSEKREDRKHYGARSTSELYPQSLELNLFSRNHAEQQNAEEG